MEVFEAIFNFAMENFPHLIGYLINSILAAFIGLGMTYVLGRMLNILKKDVPKNIFALAWIIIASFVLSFMRYGGIPDLTLDMFYFIWDQFLTVIFSVIFYVTVCFRFYDRIDHFLDKKVADDEIPKKSRRKK